MSTLTLGDLGYETLPDGLRLEEIHAYRRGWDAAARTYLRKHGGPAVVHSDDDKAPAPGSAAARMLAQTLAANARAYRVETHALYHKRGMSALRTYLRKTGQLARLAELVDPMAPTKAPRKAPARKAASKAPAPDVAPVVADVAPTAPAAGDIVAAGVATGRVHIVTVSDQRPADVAPVVDHSATVARDVAAADSGQLDELLSQARAIGAQTRADLVGDAPILWQHRKPLRRATAEQLRAAGLEPRGAVWDAATAAAGLVTR